MEEVWRERAFKFKVLFTESEWPLVKQQHLSAVANDEDKALYWKCITEFFTNIWYERTARAISLAVKDAENPKTIEYLLIKTAQTKASDTFEGFSLERLLSTKFE